MKPLFGKTQDEKKRNIIRMIYLTVAIILTLSVALAITLAVTSNSDGNSKTDETDTVLKYSVTDTQRGTLIVVNSNSAAFDFTVNSEKSLSSINSASNLYSVKSEGMKASKEALSALGRMLDDFYKQDTSGTAKKVMIYTAYRSADDQSKLNSKIKAGYSDFHTGMLFELTIDGTATSIKNDSAYNWIYDNAYKYGFIERYPIGKSAYTGVNDFDNAFRYVGAPHAKYIKENGLCLEEYVSLVQNATSPIISDGYTITYVKANPEGATEINVPSSNYSVSGDNMGGFIVAYK